MSGAGPGWGVVALTRTQEAAESLDLTSPEVLAVTVIGAVVLLGLGLFQIPLGRKLDRRLLASPSSSPAAFHLVDLATLIGAFVLAQVLVPAIYAWAKTGDPAPTPEFFEGLDAVELLALSAVGQALPATLVILLAVRRTGGLATLGLARTTPGAKHAYAVSRYVLALPTLFGLIALTNALFVFRGHEPPPQDVALLVQDGMAEHPVPIAVFAVLLIPLCEEILFRGFMLEVLVAAMGRLSGILASSAAFALMHGVVAFLPIFALAIVLSIVKLRTRSLTAAWCVHAIHNGAMVGLLHLGVSPGSP